MCGRFVLTASAEALQQSFDLLNPPAVQARYNIAPTQPVLSITNRDPRSAVYQRWGLIPSWAKDPTIGSTLFNARSETIEEKPSFRAAFKKRRCLIAADGFYEWRKDGKAKTPVFVHLKGRPLFAFAGLWETWKDPAGEVLESCTILTTEPNDVMKPLHHRMAVILRPDEYADWLADDTPPAALKAMLRPFDDDPLTYYEVSRLVNRTDVDSPDCIVPLNAPPPGQQMTLL